MYLADAEVERFYTIWFALLHYVNKKRRIVPAFPARWLDADVDPETALPIRNALWEDDTLRKAFIAENPANLSQDDLALVASWQHRVKDNFFIFRHLKKYTIFIDGSSPAKAYGVHGIVGSLEETIGPYLPIYVQAVLIPFEDRIIYDSLLSSYSLHFGGGIKHSLKEAYRSLQERGGIITSLPAAKSATPAKVQTSYTQVLKAFQKALSAAGLSLEKTQEHSDQLADFAEEYLLKQQPPIMLPDLSTADIKAYQELRNGNINKVSFKRFIWFLRDSGRMDAAVAEHVLSYLKRL